MENNDINDRALTELMAIKADHETKAATLRAAQRNKGFDNYATDLIDKQIDTLKDDTLCRIWRVLQRLSDIKDLY